MRHLTAVVTLRSAGFYASSAEYLDGRAMVEEIVLTPEQGQLGIVLKGDLAAMLGRWWTAASAPFVASPEFTKSPFTAR